MQRLYIFSTKNPDIIYKVLLTELYNSQENFMCPLMLDDSQRCASCVLPISPKWNLRMAFVLSVMKTLIRLITRQMLNYWKNVSRISVNEAKENLMIAWSVSAVGGTARTFCILW